MDQNKIKELVARQAVDDLIEPGLKIGLGTGSTAMPAVRRIGELYQTGKLPGLKTVPTSFQTIIEAEKWGLPLFSLNSREIGGVLDVAFDGADEVDTANRCVKGGGGALLLEKIVAYSAKRFVVLVDDSKLVDHLALSFPLPVEVVPEARVTAMAALERLGAEVRLREAIKKAGPVITDHGNLLLDCRFGQKVDPVALEREINAIPGVVENGFFASVSPLVYIGQSDAAVISRE